MNTRALVILLAVGGAACASKEEDPFVAYTAKFDAAKCTAASGTIVLTTSSPVSLVAADDANVYAVTRDGTILSVNEAGGVPIELASNQQGVSRIAANANGVAWIRSLDPHTFELHVIPRGGAAYDVPVEWAAADDPFWLDTDSLFVFGATGDSSAGFRHHLDARPLLGGPPREVTSIVLPSYDLGVAEGGGVPTPAIVDGLWVGKNDLAVVVRNKVSRTSKSGGTLEPLLDDGFVAWADDTTLWFGDEDGAKTVPFAGGTPKLWGSAKQLGTSYGSPPTRFYATAGDFMDPCGGTVEAADEAGNVVTVGTAIHHSNTEYTLAVGAHAVFVPNGTEVRRIPR